MHNATRSRRAVEKQSKTDDDLSCVVQTNPCQISPFIPILYMPLWCDHLVSVMCKFVMHVRTRTHSHTCVLVDAAAGLLTILQADFLQLFMLIVNIWERSYKYPRYAARTRAPSRVSSRSSHRFCWFSLKSVRTPAFMSDAIVLELLWLWNIFSVITRLHCFCVRVYGGVCELKMNCADLLWVITKVDNHGRANAGSGCRRR